MSDLQDELNLDFMFRGGASITVEDPAGTNHIWLAVVPHDPQFGDPPLIVRL